MAYDTIANTHLSNLARQGRRGDTELAHVNPQEKDMLKRMGGSGTVNPITGLNEYFFDPVSLSAYAAIGTALVGAYSSYKSGNIQEQTAKSTATAADEGLEAIKRSRESLMDKTQAGRQLINEQANIKWDEISKVSGVEKGKILKSLPGSDTLVKSGAGEAVKDEALEELAFKTESGQGSILSEHGGALGTLVGEHVTEMARLTSEEDRLNREKTLAKDMADSWYMGKYVGKASNWFSGQSTGFKVAGAIGGPAGYAAAKMYG